MQCRDAAWGLWDVLWSVCVCVSVCWAQPWAVLKCWAIQDALTYRPKELCILWGPRSPQGKGNFEGHFAVHCEVWGISDMSQGYLLGDSSNVATAMQPAVSASWKQFAGTIPVVTGPSRRTTSLICWTTLPLYHTRRDAVLTCAQKLTRVSLIYCTELNLPLYHVANQLCLVAWLARLGITECWVSVAVELMNVEAVVQCIRNTSSPQIQQQALMVMTAIAPLYPVCTAQHASQLSAEWNRSLFVVENFHAIFYLNWYKVLLLCDKKNGNEPLNKLNYDSLPHWQLYQQFILY